AALWVAPVQCCGRRVCCTVKNTLADAKSSPSSSTSSNNKNNTKPKYLHFAFVGHGAKPVADVVRCTLGGQRHLTRGAWWKSAHGDLNALKMLPFQSWSSR